MKNKKTSSHLASFTGSSLLILVFLIAAFLLAASSFFYPGSRPAEAYFWGVGNVTDPNNPHNLSVYSNNPIKSTTQTQICIFCHTPHSAISATSLLNAPLWNHTLSSQTYTLTNQKNPTGQIANTPNLIMNSTYMGGIQPDGDSELCLSCHDGTVAIGSLNNPYGTETVTSLNGDVTSSGMLNTSSPAYMGTGKNPGDPILSHYFFSIPMNDRLLYSSYYNSACAGGPNTYYLKYPWTGDVNAPGQGREVTLRPTTNPYDGTQGISGATIKTYASTDYAKADPNYSYGVQCSTCHDPHLWWTSGGQSCDFLVAGACPSGPTGTTPLCLACHISDCASPSGGPPNPAGIPGLQNYSIN